MQAVCVTCDLLSPCQHQLTFVSFVPCWPRLEARRPSRSAPRPRTSPWPTLTTRRWRWPAASPGWCGCWPGELGLAEESAVLLSDWSGTGPATPAMTTSWRWPRSCRSSGTRSWRRGRRGAAACLYPTPQTSSLWRSGCSLALLILSGSSSRMWSCR